MNTAPDHAAFAAHHTAATTRCFTPEEIRAAMKLYAVTDRTWTETVHHGKPLARQVAEALAGGVTCVQLREKHAGKKEFAAIARTVQETVRRHNETAAVRVPLIINDDADIALEMAADGVHAGQSDVAKAGGVQAIRNKLVSKMILGVSVQTVEQALQAEQSGADYLGVGAVFSTSTKPDAMPLSYETLQHICAAVHIPVVAIGGITAENAPQLAGSGIAGIAVVSALFAQHDIPAAAEKLIRIDLHNKESI